MSRIPVLCETYFHLTEKKTNLRTEVLAGITTFATMSYVLATIPNMLEQAGLVRGAVLTALICAVVLCSVAMALYTNRPFALAPGMSSVAIISTTIGEVGIPIDVAFGLVFWSGMIFVLISFIGLRELVVNAIPASVKISISAGIGLFIALIGLKTGGIIVSSASDALAFGNLHDPKAVLFVIGFVVLLVLEARHIRGSMIVSILVVTLLGIPLGITVVPEKMFNLPAPITEASFKIDILGALRPEYFPWMFTFFVPDFFWNHGYHSGCLQSCAVAG